MKRKIFEEKLYLFIKKELSKSEMNEMKNEIEKSPEHKMLYEKMNEFLYDSKKLMKTAEIKQFGNDRLLQFERKARIEHYNKAKIFKSLSVAASFLLLFGVIYISLEHNSPVNQLPGENNGNIISNQNIGKHDNKATQGNVDENTKLKQISQRIESMTADLNNSSKQKSLLSDSPAVRRIVYLTDDPKVKIYWMTN